jgi:hypothetical protein
VAAVSIGASALSAEPPLDANQQKALAHEEELLNKIENGGAATSRPVVENKSNFDNTAAVPAADGKAGAPVAVASQQKPRARQSSGSANDAEVRRLQAELDQTRSRLLVAETEVERLNDVMQARDSARVRQAQNYISEDRLERFPGASTTGGGAQAQVTTDRSALRTGPDIKSTALFMLNRGTTVTIDTRRGEWYRIITPSGVRGWIAATQLAFHFTEADEDTSRVRGFQGSAEVGLPDTRERIPQKRYKPKPKPQQAQPGK